MADENYNDPRLAAIYDALDSDRSDLPPYVSLIGEFGARSVLDIGCGTGVFALLLAQAGYDVVGLEPAAASLEVARAKPDADLVRWIEGDVHALPELATDVAVMTGNVAQAIIEDADWSSTLHGAHSALAPGGHLIFETRRPAARTWEGWHGLSTTTDIPGVGEVTEVLEVLDVALPLVRFRSTNHFAADATTIVSTSTLRYRDEPEIREDLRRHGFDVVEVREAPDRPGHEFVFIARRITNNRT